MTSVCFVTVIFMTFYALVSALSASADHETITTCPTTSFSPSPFLTTAEQRAAFERDGYVVIRGLLNETTVKEMVAAGEALTTATGENSNAQATRVALTTTMPSSVFQQVALYSYIPTVVAELMQLDPATQNLRLIHDLFFSRNISDVTRCDWHVDGHGLWPESYETPSAASKASGKDQDGINAWIALDDMPAEFRGSMAVSAGSHRAPWRYDAYQAIGRAGAGRTNGGETWEDAVQRIASGEGMVSYPKEEGGPRIRLCSLGVTAPDLYDKCEEQKRILDLKAGDVVFCSRNLFHRTLQATPEGEKHYLEKLNGRSCLHRYTIRYTAGSAVLPTGYCWLEWSFLMNPEIAGWTLDEVVAKKNKEQELPPYWFPKVWPKRPDDLQERLQELAPQIEAAKEKYKTVRDKLFAEVAEAKAKMADEDISKTAE